MNKLRITKKDIIIIIIYQFFGSTIIGSLLILNNLNYFTGYTVKIIDSIGITINILGIIFICFLVSINIVIYYEKKKHRKNKRTNNIN